MTNNSDAIVSPICGRLLGLNIDLEALQRFYLENVVTIDPVSYKDHKWEYDGWSVTSRNGEIDDNITRSKKNKDPLFGTPPKTATVPTPICFGAAQDVLNQLTDAGFKHYRARFLRLKAVSYNMQFHMDRVERQDSWRIHIPLFTNPGAYFHWRTEDGEVTQVHFPADGGAYAVRVDVMHRAVNNARAMQEHGRVHMVISLAEMPSLDQLDVKILGCMRPGGRGYPGMVLEHSMDLSEARGSGNLVVDKTGIEDTPGDEAGIDPMFMLCDRDGVQVNSHGQTESPLFPAGIAKLLLLWEVFELLDRNEISLTDTVSFPKQKDGSVQKGTFNSGGDISLETAIRALAQTQSNSVAEALGIFLFSDRENCSAQINTRARSLGMHRSHFLGVTGRFHRKTVSSLGDILLLARKLHQEFPTYLSYFEGDGFSVGEEYHKNRNLLAEEISGVTGLAVMGGANHGRLFLFSYAVDEGDYFGLVAGASDTAGVKKMTRQAIEGIKAKHDAA